ncbi:MAG: hypothetical protein ACLF0G_09600 [Candidatus Brocadiia bacterium]
MRAHPFPVACLLSLAALLACGAVAPADPPPAPPEVQVHVLGGKRARLVGPVAEGEVRNRLQARGGREIFVPQPKGSGETLDDSGSQDISRTADTVTTVRGDRLTGTVLGIDPQAGLLRLAAAHYEGEARVRVEALDRVSLLAKDRTPSGRDEVLLTNGDRMIGELAAITPQAVIVEWGPTGPVKVARRVVRAVRLGCGQSVLINSRFAEGALEPWTKRQGTWRFGDDGLHCSSSHNALVARLDQDQAVTFEARVQSGRSTLRCDMVLFADTNDNPWGHNSVVVRFESSRCYFYQVHNRSTNSIHKHNLGRSIKAGTLRFAYDPETGKAVAWLDSARVAECAVPRKPAKGQYVMFITRYAATVKSLRVLRGVVEPSGVSGEAAQKTDTVMFVNGDTVAAEQVALADGQFALKTGYGELASPIQKVETIVFRQEGSEEPRRRKGDVRVRAGQSRLTVQLGALDEGALVGESDYLGEVKIRRDAVQSIRFNIYR